MYEKPKVNPENPDEKPKTRSNKAPFDDALMTAVSTPLTFGHEDRLGLLYAVWGYLAFEGLVILGLLWGFGREKIMDSDVSAPWIFWVLIYVTVGTILKWILVLIGHYGGIFETHEINTKVKDVGDLQGLLKQENYNEALELIAFKHGNLGPTANVKYVESV